MSENLPLLDAFKQDQDTPDQEVRAMAGAGWPILALVFGGVLTLVWIAFLLWAAMQVVSWLVS